MTPYLGITRSLSSRIDRWGVGRSSWQGMFIYSCALNEGTVAVGDNGVVVRRGAACRVSEPLQLRSRTPPCDLDIEVFIAT